ncbi:hypothetical protein [Capnocytophaga sputigena]|jgi:hypothetical protein|uniref:hypothetical protein n=1 Tax=Capnocytophaga sputigena TaxID=1019 RepID=UPI0028D30276|nr:hypothetical protein [Capnocytophaga sputigena]
MKKNLLFLILLIATKAVAQIPVTDVAANGNLAAINMQLSAMMGMLQQQGSVGTENKFENYAQKILGQKNLAFIQQVEEYMWKADEYLKRGREIQMIYDKEEDILKKLKELKRNASKYGQLEGGNANTILTSVNKKVSSTLNSVGTLVDGAQTILGDKNTRMSTGERREILKETIGKLMIIESVLDNMNNQAITSKEASDEYDAQVRYQREVQERMKSYLHKK